jgi:hypothetical protein
MTVSGKIGLASVLAWALLLQTSASYAQNEQAGQQPTTRGTTANYHFAEPNELTITVSVLGAVLHPGRYEVSRSINLLSILALAGGPSETADLGDVRVFRVSKTAVKLERREIQLSLKDLTSFYSGPFELQDDDLVMIGRSSGVTFSEMLSYFSQVAVISLAVITIVNYTSPGHGLR